MRRPTRTILIIVLLCLVGCKKEEPNPELLDPIYMDLDARAMGVQKSLDEEIKKQADLAISIPKTEPNSIDLKNSLKDLAKSKAKSQTLDQMARYYRIRAKRRMLVDRITYKDAFAREKPWPDPTEYSEYKVNMRLNEVSLNWNSRVPKLQSRLEKPKVKAEKPGEGGEKSE